MTIRVYTLLIALTCLLCRLDCYAGQDEAEKAPPKPKAHFSPFVGKIEIPYVKVTGEEEISPSSSGRPSPKALLSASASKALPRRPRFVRVSTPRNEKKSTCATLPPIGKSKSCEGLK